MLDEPTRGIDVGAKAEIFEIMNRLAEKASPFFSFLRNLPEMFTIPDRVMVLSKGRVTGEFLHDQLSEEALVHRRWCAAANRTHASGAPIEISRKPIAKCLRPSLPPLAQSSPNRPVYPWACFFSG